MAQSYVLWALLGMAGYRSGFVTGAWSRAAYRRVAVAGIGAATAAALTKEGAEVVVLDRDVSKVKGLAIACDLNGESMQSSRTSNLIFPVAELIAYVSKWVELAPGDLFFTGTPEGVIFGMPPEKQVWLKAGDKITSVIEKLGELKFTLL